MKCAFCGKEIESKTGKKFCSVACSAHYNRVLIKNRSAEKLTKLKEEYNLHPAFCKNCGKPLSYEQRKGKFCDHSCSAAWNNSHRERKPWTEECRKKISEINKIRRGTTFEEAVCKHCGKPLGKIVNSRFKEGVCEECRPYIGWLKLFSKLKLNQGTLECRKDEAIAILKDLYFNQKKSQTEICEEKGIAPWTLGSFLSKLDPSFTGFRNISSSQKVAILQGRKDMPVVTNSSYRTGYHTSWEGIRFFYRSSYELDYAEYLDKSRIRYRYEDISCRTRYFDTIKNRFRVAVPDFYLPDTNEIVEIKSNYTLRGCLQELKDKVKAYRDRGFLFKLLLNRQEVNLDALSEEDL